MKHAIFIAIFCFASICQAYGQTGSSQPILLQAYYDIKNALVNGNAPTAIKKSVVFSDAAFNTDKANPLYAIITKLQTDARKISGTNDLAAQRLYFATLSSDMYALLKSAPLLKEPVYRLYCPMKKAYWLSDVQAVSNPYYGRAMLACGSVTETIKPINKL